MAEPEPPPYLIRVSARAQRDLMALPEKIATAAVEFIFGALAGNPWRAGHALRFDLAGQHSAHRGDFRVVYRIDAQAREIAVLTVRHRSDVYRRS